MALYVVKGRGSGSSKEVWNPGDPGHPNRADSKEELLAFCPKLDTLPCPAADCDGLRYVLPKREQRAARVDLGRWHWLRMGLCLRCQHLRSNHGLTLAGLLAIWESQDRRCYKCAKLLPDPRIIVAGVRGRGRAAKVDHDHTVCPKNGHSCDRCRRGLACNACNCHELAISARVGLWLLPQDGDLGRWLEFLGPEDRDRLRAGLTLFPEQPVRKVPRRRSPGESNVVPLFDLGA